MRSLVRTWGWVLVIAILVVGLSAIAAEKKGGKGAAGTPEEQFAKIDKDGNGSLSSEEFMANRKAMMEKAKAAGKEPGDAAGMEERVKKQFEKMDTNSDGSLSKDEYVAGMKAMMERGGKKGGKAGGGAE